MRQVGLSMDAVAFTKDLQGIAHFFYMGPTPRGEAKAVTKDAIQGHHIGILCSRMDGVHQLTHFHLGIIM